MKRNAKFLRGFTLLELMIAIAIVGILSAVGIASFSNTLQKARDTKRKEDFQAIQKALQLYYNDNNKFPTTTTWVYSSTNPATWMPTAPVSVTPAYIKTLPLDPTNNGALTTATNYSYGYITDANGSCYVLAARLENTSDTSGTGTFPSPALSCSSTAPTVFGATTANVLFLSNP